MAERIIYLKARPNNTKLPDDLYKESKRKIGGKLTTSGDPLRGLTTEEEEQLLPSLLAISVNDVGFRKKVNDFWSNISITVDPKLGTELQIGKDSAGNWLSPMDYIKYRYILKCPEVAQNEQKMREDPTKKYFIYDPVEGKIKQHENMNKVKESYKAFIMITSDEKNADRIDHMFRLITGRNPDILDRKDKELALEKIAREEPEVFLRYYGNKNIEMESLIAKAVSLEVLHKFGESYRYFDQMLGDNIESTVAYLLDKKNSEILASVKQKVKELSSNIKTTA